MPNSNLPVLSGEDGLPHFVAPASIVLVRRATNYYGSLDIVGPSENVNPLPAGHAVSPACRAGPWSVTRSPNNEKLDAQLS